MIVGRVDVAAIGTGEEDAAGGIELSGGKERAGVARVGSAGGGGDVVHGGGIEAYRGPVEALYGAGLALVAHTEIQGEGAAEAPVVLHEEGVVIGVLRAEGVQLEVAARGQTQEEAGKILTEGGGGGVVEWTLGPAAAEGVAAGRVAVADVALALLAEVDAELEIVTALDLGERGEKLEGVEGGEGSAGGADVAVTVEVNGGKHELRRGRGEGLGKAE